MAKDKPARGLAAKAYAVASAKIGSPSGTGHTGKLVQFANDAGTLVTDADGWYVFNETTISSAVSAVTVTDIPQTGFGQLMIEVYNIKHNDATARSVFFRFSRDNGSAYTALVSATFTNAQYATGGAHIPNYMGDGGVALFGITAAGSDTAGAQSTVLTSAINFAVATKHTGGIDAVSVTLGGVANIESGIVRVKLR